MKKRYVTLLLIVLCCTQNILPHENQTFLSRVQKSLKRIRARFVRTIKRQYSDENKRHAWISAGAIGTLGLFSWRLGAFKRVFQRKKKKPLTNDWSDNENLENISPNYDPQPGDIMTEQDEEFVYILKYNNDRWRYVNKENAQEYKPKLGEYSRANIKEKDRFAKYLGERRGWREVIANNVCTPDRTHVISSDARSLHPTKQPQNNLEIERKKNELAYQAMKLAKKLKAEYCTGHNDKVEEFVERRDVVTQLIEAREDEPNSLLVNAVLQKKFIKNGFTADEAEKIVNCADARLQRRINLRYALGTADRTELPTDIPFELRQEIETLFDAIAKDNTFSLEDLETIRRPFQTIFDDTYSSGPPARIPDNWADLEDFSSSTLTSESEKQDTPAISSGEEEKNKSEKGNPNQIFDNKEEAATKEKEEPKQLNWAQKMYREHEEQMEIERKRQQEQNEPPIPENFVDYDDEYDSDCCIIVHSIDQDDSPLPKEEHEEAAPGLLLGKKLKKLGIEIDTKKKLNTPNADTLVMLPILRKSPSKEEALGALQNNTRLKIDEETIEATMEHAYTILEKQKTAQERLQESDLHGMLDALMDGATIHDPVFLKNLIKISNSVGTTTRTAFDCIIWQIGHDAGLLPQEVEESIAQRTISKIMGTSKSRSSRPTEWPTTPPPS